MPLGEWTRTVHGVTDMSEMYEERRLHQIFHNRDCHSYKSNREPMLVRVYSTWEGKELFRCGVGNLQEAYSKIKEYRDANMGTSPHFPPR